MTLKLAVLLLGSLIILWYSRTSLFRWRHHGFYRFLAWMTILVMFVLNIDYWFVEPFSIRQSISWVLLFVSLVPIFTGVQAFRRSGQVDSRREDPALVGIEKTTRLVTSGIYHYIRHPFYASLLFLSWGIFFKQISLPSFILTLAATVFLFITARIEEKENTAFFGEAYQAYMQTTKMFIPFLF